MVNLENERLQKIKNLIPGYFDPGFKLNTFSIDLKDCPIKFLVSSFLYCDKLKFNNDEMDEQSISEKMMLLMENNDI